MLQRSVGANVHHEPFGELGLEEPFVFTGFGKAVSHVVSQIAFAQVFHRDIPLFLLCTHKAHNNRRKKERCTP